MIKEYAPNDFHHLTNHTMLPYDRLFYGGSLVNSRKVPNGGIGRNGRLGINKCAPLRICWQSIEGIIDELNKKISSDESSYFGAVHVGLFPNRMANYLHVYSIPLPPGE